MAQIRSQPVFSLRTCDAVGACMVVPNLRCVAEALQKGNTLRTGSCNPLDLWRCRPMVRRHSDETQVVGVEFTDESIRLDDLPAARTRTVVVLGNEGYGIPPEAVDKLDLAVEIPMVGAGHSLNVAVAASLVLYTLAGLL